MSDQRWDDLIYREALGEKLSLEDEAFKQAELRADPARLAEINALAGLREGLAGTPRSEDPVAARKIVKRANDRRRVRQIVWTGTGVLAAAASIALAVRMRPARAPSELAANASGAMQSLGECLKVGTNAAVCFTGKSPLDGAMRPGQLNMSHGHVVAALKPLPPGTEFSITTPHGKVTVVGTQFAVDVAPDGTRTEVRVIKGKVKVTSSIIGTEAFVEKGQFAVLGDHLETGSLGEPARERDRPLLALAKLEAGIPENADEAVEDGARAQVEGASAEAPKARHLDKGTPLAQAASAADLLEEARRLRAAGQYEPSAEAYRRLVQRYPESAEARAATVSLGQLELSQLGHPEAALHWFDKYLSGGGQLRQEAVYGKIQALQRLGRSAQERREITRFLQDFPKSAQASALRTRLDALASEH